MSYADPRPTRADVLAELSANWAWCLRCGLHVKRCEVDASVGKTASPVPPSLTLGAPVPEGGRYHLHVLLPCPDEKQFVTGTLPAVPAAGGETSSQAWLLLTAGTLDPLANHLPPGLSVAVSTSLGCRPINHDNPRLLVEPKAQWVKTCRPRVQTELAVYDAEIVLACGKHAVAGLLRGATKGWRDHLGGVIPFEVAHEGRLIRRTAYVTHSPEDVLREASRKELESVAEFTGKPPKSYQTAPYFTWLWHFFSAAWLADTVRQAREGTYDPGRSFWPHIVDSLTAHYEEVTESGNVEDLAERVRQEMEREHAGPGARWLQAHGAVDPLDTRNEDEMAGIDLDEDDEETDEIDEEE